MDVNEMTAGEELDELIAVRVMGDKLPQAWSDPSAGPSHGDPGGYRVGVKPYSTDIAAAWEVVERMRRRYLDFWCAGTRVQFAPIGIQPAEGAYIEVEGGELPLAICRAALKVAGG